MCLVQQFEAFDKLLCNVCHHTSDCFVLFENKILCLHLVIVYCQLYFS
jgi:hypothetical protein